VTLVKTSNKDLVYIVFKIRIVAVKQGILCQSEFSFSVSILVFLKIFFQVPEHCDICLIMYVLKLDLEKCQI
jgi:hypothetical protein